MVDFDLAKSHRQLFLLAYPVLLCFSGIWQNPLFALVIAFLYWVGLGGFYVLYLGMFKESRFYQRTYMFIGCMLLFISWVWLELLVKIMPFMSAK